MAGPPVYKLGGKQRRSFFFIFLFSPLSNAATTLSNQPMLLLTNHPLYSSSAFTRN
jgi:hypothetical protein